MFLNSKRVLTYLISIFLLSILILNIPIPQPIKYILFIFINFLLIIFPNKKKLNLFELKTLLSIIIFLSLTFIISILPISFNMKVQSFGNVNFQNLSNESLDFYKQNYPVCFENYIDCFGDTIEDIKITDEFKRNFLNISNINELRSNIFTSPGTTYQNNNKYVNKKNYPYLLIFKFPRIYNDSKICYFENNLNKRCLIVNDTANYYEIIGSGRNQIKFFWNKIYY